MNILVCVKQVPLAAEVKFDPVTHTMCRDNVPAILNPADALALETALTLKDQSPGVGVTLLCMGAEPAKRILKKGLSVGADHAFLVSGRFAAGSDTLATSYILSRAVGYIEQTQNTRFDLILTGKQSTDGDTAQVGPQLAEHLGYGQITRAVAVTAKPAAVMVRQQAEGGGYALLEADLPCVVTVAKAERPLRSPTPGGSRAEIVVLDQETLGEWLDLSRCGLGGSPTVVQKTFVPESKKSAAFIKADTDADAAKKLVAILCDANII